MEELDKNSNNCDIMGKMEFIEYWTNITEANTRMEITKLCWETLFSGSLIYK